MYLVISGKYEPMIVGAFSTEEKARAAVDFYLSIRSIYLDYPIEIAQIEVDRLYPDSRGAENYMEENSIDVVDSDGKLIERGAERIANGEWPPGRADRDLIPIGSKAEGSK